MVRRTKVTGYAGFMLKPLRLVGASVLLLVSTFACSFVENRNTHELPRAKFGIFFGSQLQQRKAIPFIPGNHKQQQGFRINFNEKRPRTSHVEWEVDYPTKRLGQRGPGNAPRAIRKGQAEIPQGVDWFEQRIELLPTDSLGTWNIRVRVDGELVLDRPFRVVPEGTANTD